MSVPAFLQGCKHWWCSPQTLLLKQLVVLNLGPFVLQAAVGADFGALSFINVALLSVISQIVQVKLERVGYFLSVK